VGIEHDERGLRPQDPRDLPYEVLEVVVAGDIEQHKERDGRVQGLIRQEREAVFPNDLIRNVGMCMPVLCQMDHFGWHIDGGDRELRKCFTDVLGEFPSPAPIIEQMGRSAGCDA